MPRLLFSVCTACLILLTAPALAQKKGPPQYIFSRSTTQATSHCLGITCVPSYVVFGNTNRRGVYVTSGSALATEMGLKPGTVLLTINNRVIEDAATADRVLNASGQAIINYGYVQMVNGQPRYVDGSFAYTGPSRETPSSLIGRSNSRNNNFGNYTINDLEKYMFELINKDRATTGAPAVSLNPALTGLARSYAEYMLKRGNFSHVDPDGRDPQQRAKEAGIRCGVYENLSFQTRGFYTDKDCVKAAQDQMMSEPPNEKNHRYNILLPEHKYVGVGIARSDTKIMMVQEFSDNTP